MRDEGQRRWTLANVRWSQVRLRRENERLDPHPRVVLVHKRLHTLCDLDRSLQSPSPSVRLSLFRNRAVDIVLTGVSEWQQIDTLSTSSRRGTNPPMVVILRSSSRLFTLSWTTLRGTRSCFLYTCTCEAAKHVQWGTRSEARRRRGQTHWVISSLPSAL